MIFHATIHTTSFCPGKIHFWEFSPVKKYFDFQNQMQPQFCKSQKKIHEPCSTAKNQTNSSCQAQTCVQGLQPGMEPAPARPKAVQSTEMILTVFWGSCCTQRSFGMYSFHITYILLMTYSLQLSPVK